ncbi:helix-turn-helix transcriptional regulator (plasmid) [Agrobacterium sp. rho-13.3]|uniref:helix-turn-helix transcriptional regulator n=1 Tax=Agrobacterium sp. rho-13.3 TaxID=3072980 RepID=UPI002A10E7D3|nr:helix-turn-helix transcriptional regulator [Agrobacterium sp. rho-13.3]MDX8310192.1 helix-turn-helix transcriptional regulator [Agrobacterium sp. rho-13.3]
MNALQCKLARVALGWGVRELAHAAGVSTQTISRLERGEHLRAGTRDGIKQVFESAGIEFISGDGDSFGIHIRKHRPIEGADN